MRNRKSSFTEKESAKKECKGCKKKTYVLRENGYCNLLCYYKSNNLKEICSICQKEYIPRTSNQHVCGYKCRVRSNQNRLTYTAEVMIREAIVSTYLKDNGDTSENREYALKMANDYLEESIKKHAKKDVSIR